VTWIEHFASLVALKSGKIRHPADLRGKRIGFVHRPNDRIDYARATALRGTLTALRAGGLTREDVTFVDITLSEPLVAAPPPAGILSGSAFSSSGMRRRDGIVLRALLEGHVDAVFFTSREADLAELLDAEIVFDAAAALDPVDRVSNATPIAFTVRGELVEQRPDIAVGVLAEAIRTARWAQKNVAEATRFIARDSGITEDSVASRYSAAVTRQLEPSLRPDLLRYLEIQKDFLLAEGFIPTDFSIGEFAAPEILAQALTLVDGSSRSKAA
jgi:ABC-type nitrate/sulfonate/bicarbonate transport system substrate-binding protein